MASLDGSIALTLPTIPEEVLQKVATGSYYNPHAVLGQHLVNAAGVSDPVTVIRSLRPLATEVSAVLENGARAQLTHLYGGIWQGITITGLNDYVIEARYDDGSVWTADDPYRFSPPSATSTCTSSARAATRSSGRCSAPGSRRSRASIRPRRAPPSQYGLRTPRPCA